VTPIRERDDFKALYATVLEHPDADVPRLVVADYLQEQGEEVYAEFIRVQVELATAARDGHGRGGSHQRERDSIDEAHNWPNCSGCAAIEPLERREGELWGKLVGTWDWGVDRTYCAGFVVQPSFHNFSREVKAFRLHRGFIDGVRCPLDWWVGPPCGECGGNGEVFDGYDRNYGCRACGGRSLTKNGTGRDRSNAYAPKVVREHPITKVDVVDSVGGRRWIGWQYSTSPAAGVAVAEPQRSWFVDSELWRYSVESDLEDDFDSREDALAAISRNLLAWARKESLK